MARRAGAFKSEKRKKELSRLKKRDEKLKKKLHKKDSPQEDMALQEPGVETEGTPEETAGEPAAEPTGEPAGEKGV
ncbi:MAG: hypothetical protein M0Z79_06140 [Nitrospiraceae bacterium]|nr:hypothetical protein [Nitrospiraceae bacterium]